jgi:hypothetical protein
MAKTMITGCALIDLYREMHCWGDLWEEDDVWVFNAVTVQGETAWASIESLGHGQKAVTIDKPYFGAHMFERRGVIVVAKRHCTLNHAAKEYIRA